MSVFSTDLPADMAAGLIFLDEQLVLDLLLQLGHMGNDSDQPGASCHLLQHTHSLIPGMFIQ